MATRWLDDHRSVLERATGTVTAVADPLYMVWRESDLALHPESDANSLRAAMGMAAAASSSKAEPTPTAILMPEPRPSFPMGAIVGIVVAFVVCVLAISFLGFVAFSRRGKRWTERMRRRNSSGGNTGHNGDSNERAPPARQVGGGESPGGTFASVESHARSGPEPEDQGLKGPQIMQSSREIRDSPSTGHTSHFRGEPGEVEQKVLLNR